MGAVTEAARTTLGVVSLATTGRALLEAIREQEDERPRPDHEAPAARDEPPAERLGDVLIERGLLTPEALGWALAQQERSQARLGEVLLSSGLVRRDQLHRALARIWGCDFVDLREIWVDPKLARVFDPAEMLREGWVPVSRSGAAVQVATSEQPSAALARDLAQRLGVARVDLVATSDWDIADAVEGVFRDQIADDAALALHRRDPRLSARSGLSAAQIAIGIGLLALLIGAAFLDPVLTLVSVAIAVNGAFTFSIAFKLLASFAGWRAVRRGDTTPDAQPTADSELPRYTVLVPLYGESEVVSDLVRAMEAIDYPDERLQILLLLEEEDHETITAARKALSPGNIRVVVVPDGQPRTKPRACNVGLMLAEGEFVVIFDAEDRPEPHQLRQVVESFRGAPANVTCLQARLNYFNASENLLTRLFTLEYSYWFDYMLPGLDRLRLPIPLGGTSNHFRAAELREVGGWDAYNVTEDADLGLRQRVLGQRVGVIPATTYEEACSRVKAWIPQRTRWIKGYIQTAVVHSRNPIRMVRSLGLMGTIGFLLLIAGTPLTFLAAPLVWALFGVWVAQAAGAPAPDLLPGILGLIGLATLILGNGMLVVLNALAVARRRLWNLAPFALLAPFYWMLHSYAAWRALIQYVHSPHRWEKTPHGLTAQEGPVTPSRLAALRAGLAESGAATAELAATSGREE